MNGITITRQQPLEYANTSDAVIIRGGIKTREVALNQEIMGALQLDPERQLIAAQCSGALLMAKLGLISGLPACTDLTSKPWVIEAGGRVLDAANIRQRADRT